MANIIVPTARQAEWADLEVGAIIHLDLQIYAPEHDFAQETTNPLSPAIFNPAALDTDQWVKAARDGGARYAVLVAKHCSGFCLWPTDVHPFSVKSSPWKGGKGDVVGDFFASCKKYGVKPGLYYSAAFNAYWGVRNPGVIAQDPTPEKQRAYNEMVLRQLTELWTRYGEVFEIWFDGGILPVEQGGPDIAPLLKRLQPGAVVFQAPEGFEHCLRWVGNEAGEAPENCVSTIHFTVDNFDGMHAVERAGDPFGDTWCPAESDMAGRDYRRAYQGGWFWHEGQEDTVYTADQLFETYLKTVGRNTNMLLGMVIDRDGRYPDADAAAFAGLNERVQRAFAKPVNCGARISQDGLWVETDAAGQTVSYIVAAEDIRYGERVLDFTLEAVMENGRVQEIYHGTAIGHKRIFPVSLPGAKVVRLRVNQCKAQPVWRAIALY